MKRQVLFVQGAGEGTYDEWDNKLVSSLEGLLGSNYEIRYPRMPDEHNPSYPRWKAVLDNEFARLDDGAFLVGHSVGATVLVHALADTQLQRKPDGIFLIAPPYIGRGGWPSDDIEPRDDIGKALPTGVPVYLYHGSKDDTVPSAHIERYAQAIPQALVRRIEGRDHQFDDNLTEIASDILSEA